MDSEHKCERELEAQMDSLVDEMNEKYSADLTDYARIDAKMRDIRLREDLIKIAKEVIRCRKISERVAAERCKEIAYNVQLKVTDRCICISIARSVVDRFAGSE